MPHIHSKSSRPATAMVVLVLVTLALAACGGSSDTSTKTTASASSKAPAAATTKGRFPGAARFTALRECLKKNGISLPERTPGKHPAPGIGGLLGAGVGAALPKGVSRAQYESILKKCGGGFAGRRFPGAAARFDSPEARKGLVKFAACMRENGVKIGEPNTSGKGAIFDTKGIDTTGPRFSTAEHRCQTYLRTAFGGRPGAGPGAGPGGAAAPPGAPG